jgi:hypothetical protein
MSDHINLPCDLRTETDPVSETFSNFLEYWTMDLVILTKLTEFREYGNEGLSSHRGGGFVNELSVILSWKTLVHAVSLVLENYGFSLSYACSDFRNPLIQ